MTPKEKAESLIKRFNKVEIFISIEPSDIDIDIEMADCDANKQCALIAVDEIINEYESNICNTGYDYDFEKWDTQRDYWKEVQFEISKLKTK